MVGRGASLDNRLFLGGTDGSNPVPSSAESATNLNLERIFDVPEVRFRGDISKKNPIRR